MPRRCIAGNRYPATPWHLKIFRATVRFRSGMKQVALSPAGWNRIVALYQTGEVTMNALAIRLGVTYDAIRLGLKKRGIRQTCGQLKRKIQTSGSEGQSTRRSWLRILLCAWRLEDRASRTNSGIWIADLDGE